METAPVVVERKRSICGSRDRYQKYRGAGFVTVTSSTSNQKYLSIWQRLFAPTHRVHCQTTTTTTTTTTTRTRTRTRTTTTRRTITRNNNNNNNKNKNKNKNKNNNNNNNNNKNNNNNNHTNLTG